MSVQSRFMQEVKLQLRVCRAASCRRWSYSYECAEQLHAGGEVRYSYECAEQLHAGGEVSYSYECAEQLHAGVEVSYSYECAEHYTT